MANYTPVRPWEGFFYTPVLAVVERVQARRARTERKNFLKFLQLASNPSTLLGRTCMDLAHRVRRLLRRPSPMLRGPSPTHRLYRRRGFPPPMRTLPSHSRRPHRHLRRRRRQASRPRSLHPRNRNPTSPCRATSSSMARASGDG